MATLFAPPGNNHTPSDSFSPWSLSEAGAAACRDVGDAAGEARCFDRLDGLPTAPDDGAVWALAEVERRLTEDIADRVEWGDGTPYIGTDDACRIVREVRAALAADPADTGGHGE